MNDMPIKIETGPYEHNADGIFWTIVSFLKKQAS